MELEVRYVTTSDGVRIAYAIAGSGPPMVTFTDPIASHVQLGWSHPVLGRFFQEMARDIEAYLREQRPVWQARYPGSEELRVAVMGCVVNGPGESKHADIGISLPGTFEEPKAPVYVDGQLRVTLKGDAIVAEFLQLLEEYVEQRYGSLASR